MKMRMLGVGVVLCVLAPALAMATAAPQEEASIVVTGTITVNPQGGVAAYTLHDSAKLPPVVLQIIKQTVPAWRFEPVVENGVAVTASTGMSLRVVADVSDPQHATIRVAGENFGCAAGLASELLPAACTAGATITYRQATPPRYPVDAAGAGASGEVFLALQIGSDGHVIQAAVRQVNLYVKLSDPVEGRKLLADASLRAAKLWTFNVPSEGPAAAAGKWVVFVPVNYTLAKVNLFSDMTGTAPKAPLWRAYIPGPIHPIPWDGESTSGAAANADAVAGDKPFLRDGRFVLLTAGAAAPEKSGQG